MNVHDALAGAWVVGGMMSLAGDTILGRLTFTRTATLELLDYAFAATAPFEPPRLVPFCHRPAGSVTVEPRVHLLDTTIEELVTGTEHGRVQLGELTFLGAVSSGTDRYAISLDGERRRLELSPMFHAIIGLNYFPVHKPV